MREVMCGQLPPEVMRSSNLLDAVLDAHPPAPSAAPAPRRNAREARSAEQPGDDSAFLPLSDSALLAERLELRHLHGRELRLAQLLRLVRVRVRVRVGSGQVGSGPGRGPGWGLGLGG